MACVLEAQTLRSQFVYDASAGRLYRLDGGKTGALDDGYRRIRVCGTVYREHRLVWLYVHGEWPAGVIDHINHDTLDNRIENLRDVSPKVNRENQRQARIDSKSGILGVTRNRLCSTWCAKIKTDGKPIRLGNFRTPEQAQEAYVAAKRAMHAGCTL